MRVEMRITNCIDISAQQTLKINYESFKACGSPLKTVNILVVVLTLVMDLISDYMIVFISEIAVYISKTTLKHYMHTFK